MSTQLNILKAREQAADLARAAGDASRLADAQRQGAAARRRDGVIGRVAVLVPHRGESAAARRAGDARDEAAGAVTLRLGAPADIRALDRLSQLDSAPPPQQPVLVAVVGGEICAAVSLTDGAVVADPFRPTAALVELLQQRARQLHAQAREERSRRAPSRARLALRAARTQ